MKFQGWRHMSKQSKKGLMPALRFPEFRDAGGWNKDKLFELVTTVTPPKKLPTNLYQDTGKYPIIDQSKSNICGWTNDKDSLVLEELPLIIFGDHTCILKIAHEPFAQGADGIKILKAKDQVEAEFLYQALQARPVVMEEYKRHFSILKEKIVGFPKKEFGEQQKIADCLSSLDELITVHTQKHQALQSYKKGLMQNLFPAEGKTVPALRFPEFFNEEEWSIKSMKKLFEIGNGRDHKHLKSGNIPVYGSGGYMRSVNEYLYDGESACIGRKGTIDRPVFLSGKFWTVDTLFYTHSFKGCLPKFIYLIFQNINWRSHNEAGGVPSLSKANIEKIEVALPKQGEQRKIVECISSIDDLITAQAQKIEELKKHKKGLMQRVFPIVDEVGA